MKKISLIMLNKHRLSRRSSQNFKPNERKNKPTITQLIINSITIEKEERSFSWMDLKAAFVHRKLWGVYLGQFCLGSLFIFFLMVSLKILGRIKNTFHRGIL